MKSMTKKRKDNMKVKLIAEYAGKCVVKENDTKKTLYAFKNSLLKEDFDNRKIKGIKYRNTSFFNNFYDIELFGIKFESIKKNVQTTDDIKKIKLLDSLQEGDVIVFDVVLEIKCNHGHYTFTSISTNISNIEKLNDANVAMELQYLVDEKEKELNEKLNALLK